jgi:hypothetical protein
MCKLSAEKHLHMRERGRRGYGLKDRRRSGKFHLENCHSSSVLYLNL